METGNLSERVVGSESSRALKLLFSEDDDARCGLAETRLGARGRHRHALVERGGREHDAQGRDAALARTQTLLGLLEAARLDREREDARRLASELELASRVRRP